MQPEPVPRWVILSTVFIAFGICCAGLFLTGPSWVHLVPSLPARAVEIPTATIEPSATPTRFTLPTVTPTLTRSAAPLTFPTMVPGEMPSPEPTQAPIPTRQPPPDNRFVGQGDSLANFSVIRSGPVRFTLSHTGERNFIVELYSARGEYIDLLANEIGDYDGDRAVPLPPGDYYLQIQADGQWLINVIPQ